MFEGVEFTDRQDAIVSIMEERATMWRPLKRLPLYGETFSRLHDYCQQHGVTWNDEACYLARMTCTCFVFNHGDLVPDKDVKEAFEPTKKELTVEGNEQTKSVMNNRDLIEELEGLFTSLVSNIGTGSNPDERGIILFLTLLRYVYPAEKLPSMKSLEKACHGKISKGAKATMQELMEQVPSSISIEPVKALEPAKREVVPPKKLKNHSFTNNPIYNAYYEYPDFYENNGMQPVLIYSSKQKNTYSFLMVETEPDPDLKITDLKLTSYERVVSDTVCSLILAAQNEGLPTIFTLDEIFRAMPGSGEKPNEQQKEAIAKAMGKLRQRLVHLDLTEWYKKKGWIEQTGSAKFDEYYFSYRRKECVTKHGAKPVIAYYFTSEPIFLQISKATNQLLTIKSELLAIKKTKKRNSKLVISAEAEKMTPERQQIVSYLAKRILVMKHDAKMKKTHQSNSILFDSLFKASQTDTEHKTQNARYKKFIFEALDYWTAAGFIEGYEKQIKGRSITGVTIALSPTEKINKMCKKSLPG